MKNHKILVSAVFTIAALVFAQEATAQQMYVTIRGAKQGPFKGETAGGKIPVLAFVSETDSPRDPASGLPTGKRMHKPIVITKEWDAASPQLYNALTQNENLPSVVIEFYKTNSNGVGEAFEVITLTNASVSSFKQYSSMPSGAALGEREKWVEEVGLTFQKIEIENKQSKIVAADTWEATR